MSPGTNWRTHDWTKTLPEFTTMEATQPSGRYEVKRTDYVEVCYYINMELYFIKEWIGSGRRSGWPWCRITAYRAALLTPVQFLSHDLHNAGQCLICCLHVEKAQPRPACKDIDGCAGVLFDGVQHLEGEGRRCQWETVYLLGKGRVVRISDLSLDVGELRDQTLAYNGPALACHLGHLGHFEGLSAVCGSKVLRHLVLQAIVLHKADKEGGGPTPGPLQQQANRPAGPRGQFVGFDGCIEGLLSHWAVSGPFAPWRTHTHTQSPQWYIPITFATILLYKRKVKLITPDSVADIKLKFHMSQKKKPFAFP